MATLNYTKAMRVPRTIFTHPSSSESSNWCLQAVALFKYILFDWSQPMIGCFILGIGALGDPPATPNLHQAFSPRIRYIWMYQPNGSFNVVISTCPMS